MTRPKPAGSWGKDTVSDVTKKRDVTNRGIYLTFVGAKNVTSSTGGSNWPFRCLDIILSSWTRQYACDWRRVWRIMALKLTEEWRPWQRKSKLLSSWIILVAWAVHLRVDNKVTLIQRAAHTRARILKMYTEYWVTWRSGRGLDNQEENWTLRRPMIVFARRTGVLSGRGLVNVSTK